MTPSSKSECNIVYLACEQEIFVLLAGGKLTEETVWVRPFLGYISELSWGGEREAFYIN